MEFVHLNYFETKKDIGKEIKAFVQKNFSKTIKKPEKKKETNQKKTPIPSFSITTSSNTAPYSIK